ERNYQKREIEDAAYRHLRLVESGERVIVGVNTYALEDSQPMEILRLDPEAAQRQIDRVRRVRAERDNAATDAALRRLAEAANTPVDGHGANTMPAILECVETYATLGEICGVLREAFGEYVARV
ncbi:MAG: methylmalonyl-CoA mutase family protein, partial [Dehalococcoidia bacterium]